MPGVAKGKAASLSINDAAELGGFSGGITTLKKLRFGMGYPKQDGSISAETVITLRIDHLPKGDDEPRREILSMGNAASKHWTVAKNGRKLIAKHGAAILDSRSGGMKFLGSLLEKGFPERKLAGGDVGVVDGSRVLAALQPVTYEGLAGDDGKPRTQLVVSKILKTAFDADTETEDEEEEETEETEEEETEEEETEEESEEEEDEGESEDEDEDEEEEADEDGPAVKVAVLDKHLKAILEKAGGSVKRTQLAKLAFAHLKKDPALRNQIAPRLVEPAFLKRKKGWTFSEKTGTVALV